MKDTHHCIICGKGYIFCDSCRKVRGYTPWKTIVDSPECYQLHLLIAACEKESATEEDFQNLERLASMIAMTDTVANAVDQLLKNHK